MAHGVHGRVQDPLGFAGQPSRDIPTGPLGFLNLLRGVLDEDLQSPGSYPGSNPGRLVGGGSSQGLGWPSWLLPLGLPPGRLALKALHPRLLGAINTAAWCVARTILPSLIPAAVRLTVPSLPASLSVPWPSAWSAGCPLLAQPVARGAVFGLSIVSWSPSRPPR